jgi:signal transduction histidine kinase
MHLDSLSQIIAGLTPCGEIRFDERGAITFVSETASALLRNEPEPPRDGTPYLRALLPEIPTFALHPRFHDAALSTFVQRRYLAIDLLVAPRQGTLVLYERLASSRLESALDALALDAVWRVVSDAAHEINNPLTSLMTGLDTLIDFEPLTDDVLSTVLQLRSEVVRLSEIVRRMRRRAKIDTGALATLDVESELRTAVTALVANAAPSSTDERPRVAIDVEPAAARAIAHPTILRLAVERLVANALEASAERCTEVAVRARLHEDDRSGVPTHWLELEVSDAGRGMSREARLRAGEAFWSTRPGGAGLGLHSLRRALAAVGGWVALRTNDVGETCASALFRIEPP